MYVSWVQRGIGSKIPLTRVCAESEEASRALIRVWRACGAWSAESIPQISPKNWRSMVEHQDGPYVWSPPFSREPSFATRPRQAKCTEWYDMRLAEKGLFTMNSRLFARAHTGGTWAYSRHTERKKVQLSTKSNRTMANETDLDFLLTTGHAACLAASIFGSSTLSRVRSSGKGRCEIERIAWGLRLLRRVIRRQVMA